MKKTERPLTLLIGALGGQGGGVLTDWLVVAAQLAGYPAQATSIPGVAQRTGATTYYFELFPEKNPAGEPIFCLFPSAGDVDLVAALEPMEAGKALQSGYISELTTVITSTQRIYSTAEKSVAGDGTVAVAPVLAALAGTARRVIAVDAERIPARQLNAILFGAIIGSGVLPLSVDQGRAAIEAKGLAVAANLDGYDAGVGLSAASQERPVSDKNGHAPVYARPPVGLSTRLASFPVPLHPLIGHGAARLVDYQDEAYARCYLDRLQVILAADGAAGGAEQGFQVTGIVARRLAAWMSYEDVIRVAQLKTRKGRLATIRQEMGAVDGQPVRVTDFFSPGRAELMGIAPAWLTKFLAQPKHARGRHLAWPTSSYWGYGGLKFLSLLKPLRQRTSVFSHEQAVIELWLAAVESSLACDYLLAEQTAEVAVWARGYGVVRARGLQHMATLFKDWQAKINTDWEAVRRELHASLHSARHDPENPGAGD